MLDAVQRAGVFGGYLEDLVYTPKTLKALAANGRGAGRRAVGAARETHAGPHSAWFWDAARRRGDRRSGLPLHRDRAGRSWARRTGRSR